MKKEFILSILVSLTFLLTGFLLLHYELIEYGLSLFVFLPFILGYLLGKNRIKKASLWGLIFSIVVFFILLLLGNLEGMVCILMALPIVIVALLIGVLIRNLLGKKEKEEENILKSSVLPFCIFLFFGFAESKLIGDDRSKIEIKSEIILPYSTLEVYDVIKSVDTLNVEQSFLMKLDLPVPHKCILEEEKVGGIRTCYFETGHIVEKVTALEKGKLLKMDVIDYQLTGRTWLEFHEAIYHFEELEEGLSKLTRITTYSSKLYPRQYWKTFERIGIEQEHDFVFRNLEKDLKEKDQNH